MVRTQISLTKEQMEALREASHRRSIPIAAFVREAVDVALSDDRRRRRIRRALDAVMSADRGSGLDDVARDHDRYLADAFRE